MTVDQRKLAAILFADIVGYTSSMQADERKALIQLNKFKDTIRLIVPAYEGEVINFYGDGCLAIFSSAVNATACSQALQQEFQKSPIVPVRIGLHNGEIILKEENVFGDAVNIASRIESMAEAGSVLLSSAVRNQIKNKIEFSLQSLGKFEFKNVDGVMTIYALNGEGLTVPNAGRIDKQNIKSNRASGKRSLTKYLAGSIVLLLLFQLALSYEKLV